MGYNTLLHYNNVILVNIIIVSLREGILFIDLHTLQNLAQCLEQSRFQKSLINNLLNIYFLCLPVFMLTEKL